MVIDAKSILKIIQGYLSLKYCIIKYTTVLVPNSPSQSTIFRHFCLILQKTFWDALCKFAESHACQTRAVAATGLEGTNDEMEGLKPDDSPERMTGQNLLGKYQVCTKGDDGFHQL